MPCYQPNPRKHPVKPSGEGWLFSEQQQLVCHFKTDTRQSMPNGWPSAPIDEYHVTHLFLKLTGGCSGIKPLRTGRQCSRSAGIEALHRFGEQTFCDSRGMVQTNRNEQNGQSTGSGETRGIHGSGKASATWLEGSESKLELSMG